MSEPNQKPKTAILFIGIPASGKSSYYQAFWKDTHVRINLDTLRTRYQERMLLEACLREGKSFVVDNTNPTREDRERYIVPAKAHGYRVEGYFFQSLLEECVERNNRREGKARIPAKAVATISNKLEMPSPMEGFDRLYFVHMENGGFVTEEWRD